LFGLFAAVNKISLLGANEPSTPGPSSSTPRVAPSATSTAVRSGIRPPTNLSKKASGSQESLVSEKSSVYSTASKQQHQLLHQQQLSSAIKKPATIAAKIVI
jgi:hypothetical protein